MYGGLPSSFGFGDFDLADLASGAGQFAMAMRPEWKAIQAAAIAARDGLHAEAEACRFMADYSGLGDPHTLEGEVP